MEKIKDLLTSEGGMKIVNILFLASILIPGRGFVFAAYTCWIIYLTYCIKHTTAKAARVVNSLFILFAAIMILVNLCLMLKRS